MEYLVFLLFLASGKGASTYGYGENYCGDPQSPRTCDSQARTASGLFLKEHKPIVALAMQGKRVIREPVQISISVNGSPCFKAILADKKNVRYKETQPWDLTPEVLRRAGVRPSSTWSGTVHLCSVKLKDGREFKNL